MAEEREVGGLRCAEVLAMLPDFVDGALEAQERAQVEVHLRGCGWCARFGGQYAALVAELRALRPGEEEAAAGEGA
jgi:anti-sigma factor RsiW